MGTGLTKLVLAGLTTLLVSSSALADSENQVWSSLGFEAPMAERFALTGEVINRYSEEEKKLVTRASRVGVKLKFENKAYYSMIFENRIVGSLSSDEVRIIHELSRDSLFDDFKINFRGRLEHREFASSPQVYNRLRLRLKVDAPRFDLAKMTPYLLAEQMKAINRTDERPYGAAETRLGAGFGFAAFGGKINLGLMHRVTSSPAFKGKAASESKYTIAEIGLRWAY